MHHEGTGRGVAQLGRDLVADALALVDRHVVLLAPTAGALVQVFFGRRGGRDHVVDEQRIPVGFGDLLDAELFLHLAEDHVGVAREIVSDHEIRFCEQVIAGPHFGFARHAGEDLFGYGEAHAPTSLRIGFSRS